MAEKKRQHYVPKFYLRNFADINGFFSVFQISKRKTIEKAPYRKQCYENYYYGTDKMWEHKLEIMESEWGAVFHKIIKEEPLCIEDRQAIARFAIYQRQRTLTEGEYAENELKEMMTECIKLICESKNWKYEREYESIAKDKAKASYSPSYSLNIAEKYSHLTADLDLLIIHYTTTHRLITSDVPVIAINPFYPHGIGYKCMGLIILFPVDPNRLAVLYDAKVYPKYKGIPYTHNANENEVLNLNKLQLISAGKALFSRFPQEFSCIPKSAWAERKKNRDADGITKLGYGMNQMWISNMRASISSYDYSFAKMANNFKGIPFVCREAFTRNWDAKWENKLATKADVLTITAKHSPGILKSNNITIKELRKGCEKMLREAKKYWKDYESVK